MATDLAKITPPRDLSDAQKALVFEHFFRRLATYRNTAVIYAILDDTNVTEFEASLNVWGQSLLEKAWLVCRGDDTENCPQLDSTSDTATIHLDKLPPQEDIAKILNTILFLDITASTQYSARTRVFLASLGPLDESAIVAALKNPDHIIDEAQKQAETSRRSHADKGKTLRIVGMGVGAVAGGILLGVTGGLAAPLVGAGVTTVLGWLGMGGSVIGLLASGLAGSSVVCGALFGVYGARSTASMVERHTKDVSDLALVPIRSGKDEGNSDTLGVRLCVSGWLDSPEDVTAPWRVLEGDDTYALQWEMNALQELSDAMSTLVKSQAMNYVKAQVIKRTVFATLMNSLAPLALLRIGQIIDNPWMNARALAIKTGAVLGDMLANRVFGNRPVTLTGYSLGALVIYEALQHLARLPPSQTRDLIEDVFLFGTPVGADGRKWTSVRRVVSGRLVNGYARDDYVLGVLCRASEATWEVAGLEEIDAKGVENMCCEGVEGDRMWRTIAAKYVPRT
uniref:DUF726-domain-containing protein n=1 Tax=Psilocybe cubensis TaxID=181762 RepID=A0A8H7Y2Z9_PSICU